MSQNMKPIIFNTEMVKAILDGRKTQFREVIKDNDLVDTLLKNGGEKTYGAFTRFSKYKVNDILYVKETFTLGKKEIIKPENVWYIRNDLGNDIFYKADIDYNFYDPDLICKWKPSVHLKQKDARIFLNIINVRVERLHDILRCDIDKEGFLKSSKTRAIDWWINLWNSTAKDKYKWENNPYVFVYEFEKYLGASK